MPSEITMSAKFPGKCKACGYRFPAGTWIKFDLASKTAVHRECPEPDPNEQKNIFEMWIERAKETEEAQKQMRGGKG